MSIENGSGGLDNDTGNATAEAASQENIINSADNVITSENNQPQPADTQEGDHNGNTAASLSPRLARLSESAQSAEKDLATTKQRLNELDEEERKLNTELENMHRSGFIDKGKEATLLAQLKDVETKKREHIEVKLPAQEQRAARTNSRFERAITYEQKKQARNERIKAKVDQSKESVKKGFDTIMQRLGRIGGEVKKITGEFIANGKETVSTVVDFIKEKHIENTVKRLEASAESRRSIISDMEACQEVMNDLDNQIKSREDELDKAEAARNEERYNQVEPIWQQLLSLKRQTMSRLNDLIDRYGPKEQLEKDVQSTETTISETRGEQQENKVGLAQRIKEVWTGRKQDSDPEKAKLASEAEETLNAEAEKQVEEESDMKSQHTKERMNLAKTLSKNLKGKTKWLLMMLAAGAALWISLSKNPESSTDKVGSSKESVTRPLQNENKSTQSSETTVKELKEMLQDTFDKYVGELKTIALRDGATNTKSIENVKIESSDFTEEKLASCVGPMSEAISKGDPNYAGHVLIILERMSAGEEASLNGITIEQAKHIADLINNKDIEKAKDYTNNHNIDFGQMSGSLKSETPLTGEIIVKAANTSTNVQYHFPNEQFNN